MTQPQPTYSLEISDVQASWGDGEADKLASPASLSIYKMHRNGLAMTARAFIGDAVLQLLVSPAWESAPRGFSASLKVSMDGFEDQGRVLDSTLTHRSPSIRLIDEVCAWVDKSVDTLGEMPTP